MLPGMKHLPGSEIQELMSPALPGGLFSTEPPGKPGLLLVDNQQKSIV